MRASCLLTLDLHQVCGGRTFARAGVWATRDTGRGIEWALKTDVRNGALKAAVQDLSNVPPEASTAR